MLRRTPCEGIDRNVRWNLPEQASVAELIVDRHASIDPRLVALIHEDLDGTGAEYTFAQSRDLANQVGNALRANANRRYLGMAPQALADGSVAELVRAGAARIEDGVLLGA